MEKRQKEMKKRLAEEENDKKRRAEEKERKRLMMIEMTKNQNEEFEQNFFAQREDELFNFDPKKNIGHGKVVLKTMSLIRWECFETRFPFQSMDVSGF